MSVPYSRPDYGYDNRSERDYDSRRRTYRPTRPRGAPPAKLTVSVVKRFRIIFCIVCIVCLKHAERDPIGEDIVVTVS